MDSLIFGHRWNLHQSALAARKDRSVEVTLHALSSVNDGELQILAQPSHDN
jgi:hypothetical protein